MTRIRGNTWGRRRVLERVSFRVCSAEFWESLLCGKCRGFPGPEMEGSGLRSGLAQAGRKRCLGARVRRAEALLWNRVGDQNRPGWSGSSYSLRLRVGGDGGRGGTGAWWWWGRRRGPVSPWSLARTLGSQGFPAWKWTFDRFLWYRQVWGEIASATELIVAGVCGDCCFGLGRQTHTNVWKAVPRYRGQTYTWRTHLFSAHTKSSYRMRFCCSKQGIKYFLKLLISDCCTIKIYLSVCLKVPFSRFVAPTLLLCGVFSYHTSLLFVSKS